MKTKKILWLCVLLLAAVAPAQAQFTLQGRIEYERRCNLRRLWVGNDWLEKIADKIDPIMVTYSNLDFDSRQSRYSPGRAGVVPKMNWGLPPGDDNVVEQDFQSRKLWAQKNFYGEKFQIQDSLPRLKWRIESEVRQIAGYACRKAVTRICDSVYVVAFYTEAIPVPAGPEQMGGLPGMILELAVPRLYTTWIATKVEEAVPRSEPAPPAKGKVMTREALAEYLHQHLEDWGKQALRNIWWAML